MWSDRVREALQRGQWASQTLARKLRSHLRTPPGFLVYHPDYEPPEQKLTDTRRAAKILTYLHRVGCITTKHVRRAPRPSLAEIGRVHDTSYVAALQDPDVVQRIFGMPVSEAFAEAAINQQRRMVGGTLLAARRAASDHHSGRPVVNLGGGFHHAYAERGSGFCVFNDVAIAIAELRQRGFDGQILVLDLDLHQGDGTRRIFADDRTVFTCSIHAVDWDEEPAEADINVALGPGIGDRTYLGALTEVLPEAFERAQPDLVFYVAGVDVADDDQLGSWWVSPDGLLLRDQLVIDAIGQRPSVWLLAGGYGRDAWRHTARSLGWLFGSYDEPIDSRAEVGIARFRKLAERLDVGSLSSTPSDDDMGLSETDLMGNLFRRPQHFKLLGLYTPYGIECALEQYGALEKVRQLGYRGIDVLFELDHPTGQLMRIFSDDERRDLLVEAVLRKDDRHSPYNVLFVEWLLMQNPRAQPTAKRPLLPGQKYPGLGVMKEALLMLVMVCERLELDGLAYNPAHYHLAKLGRGLGLFVDPELQGRFNAMEAAVEGLPLIDATRIFARGLATDRTTDEPVRWQTGLIALPVSDRLRERFEGSDYESAVGTAAARYDIAAHPDRLGSGSFAALGT